ncbi:ECF RNA polymerase sigma factor SigE [Stieleria maiorica]|uniref:ECF RNA polymerase sigma factor SigE n=1 Tax=Stieleria maiorica TaxID=2795974 RepID=A0A5B9MLX1_9BACT|nr:sigma-70 family RNA polymerase sigma factor [Stieleria maiorica]QEG00977.1 ECF RNA polymerase sigma factor SigE [Stieleria maiorica]
MSEPSAAEMLADGHDSGTIFDADAAAKPPPPNRPSWAPDELSQLISQYEGQLLAYARRMLGGDWQAAQDVVQETFLRLCREDREKIAARVQPWLFAVCRSRVIDMQRTKHAHPIDAAEITVQDPHPDAPAAALAAEQADATESRLAVLVGRLSKRQQEVLRLRMQAGLSYREIAEVTGLTVSNVGFHLHAAVRSLKDAVATT